MLIGSSTEIVSETFLGRHKPSLHTAAMTLAQRLRIALGGRKQTDLAAAVGVTAASVSQWMRDDKPTRPGDDKLLRAADWLGVRYAWLLTGEGPMERRPEDAAAEDAAGERAPAEIDDEALELAVARAIRHAQERGGSLDPELVGRVAVQAYHEFSVALRRLRASQS